MRRRPDPVPYGPEARPATLRERGFPHEDGLRPFERPTDQGDAVRPFCVSGGVTRYLDVNGENWAVGEPPSFGAQFVTSVYVPEGRVGFLKDIKIAPFLPYLFAIDGGAWVRPEGGIYNGNQVIPGPVHGVWQTPFGWEGYRYSGLAPSWRWHLRMLSGRVEDIRNANNVPPFSLADPLSWYLVPNIAVPHQAYPLGFPGTSPGQPWASQRMQRVGNWEEGEVHVPIPGDTTACLFAEWRGIPPPVNVQAIDAGGEVPDVVTVEVLSNAFILNPSFGQLIGYTLPDTRTNGQEAARFGWQS